MLLPSTPQTMLLPSTPQTMLVLCMLERSFVALRLTLLIPDPVEITDARRFDDT